MTSRTLFMRFNPRSNMSSRAALPAAGHGEAKNTEHHPDQHPPRFEVCGEPRDYNLARPWQRSPPCALAPCQSGSVGMRTPIPAGGITGHTRWESQPSSAARVNSSPGGQGMVTQSCIVLTRSQFQKWRQPCAGRCSLSSEHRSRNSFTGVPPAGKGPVSPESRRKQLPAPTGMLCLSEQI